MNIAALLKLVGTERDSAMLRLTLARLLAADDDLEQAAAHLEAAVDMDRNYTAAWKELGKVRLQSGDTPGAAQAWQTGIESARACGDKQAEKEMTVFLKRLK
jgi:predicted negative regulator of RcsB-dependent stress response